MVHVLTLPVGHKSITVADPCYTKSPATLHSLGTKLSHFDSTRPIHIWRQEHHYSPPPDATPHDLKHSYPLGYIVQPLALILTQREGIPKLNPSDFSAEPSDPVGVDSGAIGIFTAEALSSLTDQPEAVFERLYDSFIDALFAPLAPHGALVLNGVAYISLTAHGDGYFDVYTLSHQVVVDLGGLPIP
jgi:hypothetical protein